MMVATGQGIWGFTFRPVGAAGTAFTQAGMQAGTTKAGGVPWVVQLNAWQSAGGQRSAVGMPIPLRALITWTGGGPGVAGGGQEQASIDYPASGTVITLHATSIKVDIVGTVPGVGNTGPAPILSGFLSVGRGHERPQSATATEPIRIVVDGAGFSEQVPPRARAYRIMFLTAQQTSVLQLSGDATPVGLVADTVHNVAAASFDYETPQSKWAWFPLHPHCQAVSVHNDSGVGGVLQYSIQWILELD